MDFPTDSSRIVRRRLPLSLPLATHGVKTDKGTRTRRLLAACSAGRRLVALVRHRVAIRDFFELQPSIPQMEVICKPQHKPF